MIIFSTMGHAEALKHGVLNRDTSPGFTRIHPAFNSNRAQLTLVDKRTAGPRTVLETEEINSSLTIQDFQKSNYAYIGGETTEELIRTQITAARQGNEASYTVPLPGAVFPIGNQRVPGTLVIASGAPFIKTAEGLFLGDHILPKVNDTAAFLWVPVPIQDGSRFSENLRIVVGVKPLEVNDRVRGIEYGFHNTGSPLLIRPGDAFLYGTTKPDTLGGAVVFPLDLNQYRFMRQVMDLKEPFCEEEARIYEQRINQLNLLYRFGNIGPETIEQMNRIAIASPAIPGETVIQQ